MADKKDDNKEDKNKKKKEDEVSKDPTKGVKNKIDTKPKLKEAIDFLLDSNYEDFDELQEEIQDFTNEIQPFLKEDLSQAQRLKRRAAFRRNKAKIQQKRKIAMNRRADNKTTQKRSRKYTINQMKKKLARGRNVNKLSVSEKNRLERIIKRRKNVVDRLAKKNIRVVRDNERKRLNHRTRFEQHDQNVNSLYETFASVMDLQDDQF